MWYRHGWHFAGVRSSGRASWREEKFHFDAQVPIWRVAMYEEDPHGTVRHREYV
jgi:hypothetical protein